MDKVGASIHAERGCDSIMHCLIVQWLSKFGRKHELYFCSSTKQSSAVL